MNDMKVTTETQVIEEDAVQSGADAVCAVIVCYNGKESLPATLDALKGQVGRVVIIDNGSGPETVGLLETLRAPGVELFLNAENRGVAAALNQGVAYALAHGFKWVLTMDQDSVADPGMIAELLGCAEACSGDGRYLSFAPIFIDAKHTRESYRPQGKRYQERRAAITSGNLVSAELFRSIGMFEERLFIDCVDLEFCLRLRSRGYRIVRCPEALLAHNLGEAVTSRLLGFKIATTRHTPERRYYIWRNHVYLLKKYLRIFPLYCLRKQLGIMNLIAQIILLEPDKSRNLKYLFKGFRDGVLNRLGPMERT